MAIFLRKAKGFFSRSRDQLGNIRVRFYSDDRRTVKEGPHAFYTSMVQQGKLRHDPNQERVAKELDRLLENLHRYEREMEEYHENLAAWEKSREIERRQLLLNDAELKQQDKPISKKRHEHAEPGVGKMVSYFNREKKLDSLIGRRPIAPSAPKGLYLYGNVGSGKTMLMDMFYKSTESVVKHRRRFHFHEAMLEIHEHMHDVWKNRVEENSFNSDIYNWISNLPFDRKVKEWLIGEEKYKQETQIKHILPTVADRFLLGKKSDQCGATILCFDEIQTIDVFAVVALSGILSRLLSTGTVLVATSNRLPEDLNQDGMQQDIFFKLVAKLEENCSNILVGNEIDYRRLIPKRKFDQVQYFWPLDSEASSKFDEMWVKMISQFEGEIISETIPVMFGRKLEVPESCNGMARFNFEYLCGRPIGAADYIAIARGYHTVFISEIPAMSMRIRDRVPRESIVLLIIFTSSNLTNNHLQARRFITLVDELYNHHCCLYCSASVSIDDLFKGSEEGTLFDLESFQFETEIEGSKLRRDVLAEASIVDAGTSPSAIVSLLSGQEELFAFRRAVSRLVEMQTPLYLEGVRRLHPYFEKKS